MEDGAATRYKMEKEVIKAQQRHLAWNKTTQKYKAHIANYEQQ